MDLMGLEWGPDTGRGPFGDSDAAGVEGRESQNDESLVLPAQKANPG